MASRAPKVFGSGGTVLRPAHLLGIRQGAQQRKVHGRGDVVGRMDPGVVAVAQPGHGERDQETGSGPCRQEPEAIRGLRRTRQHRVLVRGQLHADRGVLVAAGLQRASLVSGGFDCGVRDVGGLLGGAGKSGHRDDRGIRVQLRLQGNGDGIRACLHPEIIHDGLPHRTGVEQRQVGLRLVVLELHVAAGLLNRIARVVGLRTRGDVAERTGGVHLGPGEREAVACRGAESDAEDEQEQVAQKQPEEVFRSSPAHTVHDAGGGRRHPRRDRRRRMPGLSCTQGHDLGICSRAEPLLTGNGRFQCSRVVRQALRSPGTRLISVERFEALLTCRYISDMRPFRAATARALTAIRQGAPVAWVPEWMNLGNLLYVGL